MSIINSCLIKKKKKGEMQLSTAIILNAPGQRQQQIPDMIPWQFYRRLLSLNTDQYFRYLSTTAVLQVA